MNRPVLVTVSRLCAGAALLFVAASGGLHGQDPDTVITHVDSVIVAPEAVAGVGTAVDEAELPITPRAAFIRSLVIPGWGQSAFGAYTRGGIYFAGWTGNWFMNVKNHVRLDEARNRLDLRTAQVRDSLIHSPPSPDAPPNPDSMRAVLDTTNLLETTVRADAIGADLRGLVSSREQQREDWIAWSLFWILASGIDAYVTAHLADFPATIDVEPNLDRSVSVRVDVPWPRRRP
jgi:hypothetical protein